MRPWRLLLLLHALALPAHAILIEGRVVMPAAPTNLTPVVLHLWGLSSDPAHAPVLRSVRTDGKHIVVEMRPSGVGRISVVHAWDERIPLGPLPGGDYDISIHYVDNLNRETRYPIALEVRDVTTLPVETHIIGTTQQHIALASSEVPAKAWLGEHRLRVYDSSYIYPDEPLPEGLYDLTVQWDDGSTDVARNAVQVAAAPETAIFGERLLVPVFYDGFDAANMRWESSFENAENEEDVPWLRSHPAGVFFAAPGPRIPPYILRIRRVLPGDEGPLFARWTRIPVVSEAEFRERVTLLNVVLDPRKRTILRVYSLEPAQVSCIGCETSVFTKKSRDGEPAFASIAIPAECRCVATIELSARESPLWAMVASTDAATGELEVVTP